MNTSYVPVRKIIKIVSSSPRNPKHDRRPLLQECSSKGTRRRYKWNPWVILFCLLAAVAYLYWNRTFIPTVNKQIFINEINYNTSPQGNIKSTEHVTQKKKKKVDLNPTTKGKLVGDFYTLKDTLTKFKIKMESVDLNLQNVYPHVKKGGSYKPVKCKAQFKVGIIVSYRNRERNLGTFLNNIHPFLMQQKLNYQIFVIEQYGDELFNKGRVYNAGFSEMMKFNTFDCIVFHDLDLLPMDEKIIYNCPTLPRHMCARVNDTAMKAFDPSYQYQSLFGGVVSMTREQFQRANGFSNLYFGWGGEDNDMFWRLRAAGYPVVRYNSTVGVYLVLPHKREPSNPYRHHLLIRAMDRYKVDGLSNSEYYVISTRFRPLCTHIVVNINPRDENITELNQKWAR